MQGAYPPGQGPPVEEKVVEAPAEEKVLAPPKTGAYTLSSAAMEGAYPPVEDSPAEEAPKTGAYTLSEDAMAGAYPPGQGPPSATPLATGSYTLSDAALQGAFPAEGEAKAAVLNTGPILVRLKSRDWKVRMSAYSELKLLLEGKTAPFEELYTTYLPAMNKMSMDVHAASLGQAICVIEAFAAQSTQEQASEIARKTVKGIVSKGLGASRKAFQQQADTTLLALIQAGAAEEVLAQLQVGAKAVQWKVALNTATCAQHAVAGFGIGVIHVGFLKTVIGSVFSHTNGKVRDAGITLCVEVQQWIGDALFDLLTVLKIKPTLIKSIRKGIEALPDQSPKTPTMFVMGASEDSGASAGDPVAAVDIDSFIPAVDVFAGLPKKFSKAVLEGKRVDRVAAIESFYDKCAAAKKISANPKFKKLYTHLRIA
jgi:hypothetical protein